MPRAVLLERPIAPGETPPVPSLAALKPVLDQCRRCPLWRHATQGVPGAGPSRAPLMLVGEQPGNDEDLAGKPFVGPAGRMLDRALAAAGIARDKVYVTNAVKHFKFEPRGKRRLHKRPNAGEIKHCRWWLQQELELVRPRLVVALGATAAYGLLERTITIGKERGRVIEPPDGPGVLVTIHPSYLLRIREEADRQAEYDRFVRDLQLAARYLAA